MNEINFEIKDVEKINLSMDVGIKEIYPPIENLEITPTKEQQVFNHENSYGYDNVKVNPIPNEYIIPEGTLPITENATYDVTNYARVSASVYPAPYLQDKEVTPNKETQNITSDEGYDGLNEVIVNPIPDEYIVPTGTLEITKNGSYDVKQYAEVQANIEGGSSGESIYNEEGYISYGLVSWWEGSDNLDESYRWLSRVGDDYISQYKPTLKTDGSNSFGNIKTADAYVNNKTYGLVTNNDYWNEEYTIEVVGKMNSQTNSNNSSGGTFLAFDRTASPMMQIYGSNDIFACLNQYPEQGMPYLFKNCLGKRYKYAIGLQTLPGRTSSGTIAISYALNDSKWYTRSTSGQSAHTSRPNLTILSYYRDSYMADGEINSIRIYSRRLNADELKHNYEIDKARFNLDDYEE